MEGIFIAIMLMYYFVVIAVGIGAYVLQSLAIYTVASRRAVSGAWTAWIFPFWAMGGISDQYQGYAKGKKTNRRKLLTGCYIGFMSCMVFYIVFMVMAIVGGMEDDGAVMILSVLLLVVCSLALLVVAVIMVVYNYIVLYDIFSSCEPKNATAYLVISIIFSPALPILLFMIRNKDDGMVSYAQQQWQAWNQQQQWQQWQAQQAWQAQQQQAWQAQQWQAQQQQAWQAHQTQQQPPQQPPQS